MYGKLLGKPVVAPTLMDVEPDDIDPLRVVCWATLE
jgi:hypothetical protein